MDYRLKAETGKFKLSGKEISLELKRGDISWAYFPIAYNILLTIALAIITSTNHSVLVKITTIIIISLLLFYLCFFGPTFRNKIIGLFLKSKNYIEKS